jgi:hypothetical protein
MQNPIIKNLERLWNSLNLSHVNSVNMRRNYS